MGLLFRLGDQELEIGIVELFRQRLFANITLDPSTDGREHGLPCYRLNVRLGGLGGTQEQPQQLGIAEGVRGPQEVRNGITEKPAQE